MRISFPLVLLIFILTACQPYSEAELYGEWKIIELTEEGDSLAVDLNELGFQFKENGRYHFQSTLKYEEAGTYRLDGPFLFSTDTTQESTTEKAVEILQLSGDTLILLMQEAGKDRSMILKKE